MPAEDFTAEVNALVKAINDRDLQMRDILAGQPLGETNVREYRDIWHAISVRAVESLRGSAGGNAAASAAIGRAVDQLRTNPQVRREFDQHAQMSKAIIKNLSSRSAASATACTTRGGLQTPTRARRRTPGALRRP